MVNIIYGRAAAGKTALILNRIEKAANEGKEIVYIVPEQFSFESERSVLSLLGDELSGKVNVVSFSSLADILTDICGGACRNVLSDSDKIMFMSEALKSLKEQLSVWRKYISSVGFASKVTDMIGEFKISAIFPEDIEKASENVSGSLKEKMKALALTYRAYDALLGQRFIDPADRLQKLYNDLLNFNYFDKKSVFIDGFKGFTGQQYKILDLIISRCDSLDIALLGMENDESVLFENTRKTAINIKDIAKKYRRTLKDEYLPQTHFVNDGVKAAEEILSHIKATAHISEGVTVCTAKSRDDEVKFVARNIRRLVREKNYRYRDFVVIAREPEAYERAIEREFAVNDISCFFDKRVPLTISPIYSLLDCVMECSVKFSSEALLRCLKTGLFLDFDDESISELENYVYLWDINGNDWLNDWDMDPTGFSKTETDRADEIKEQLEKINALRKKAIKEVLKFKDSFMTDVKGKSKALADFLFAVKADENMKKLLSEADVVFSAADIDVLRQSWDCIMNVFDSLVKCFGEDTVTVKEFREMFNLACSMTTVGRIPQMLDEVTFGAADRIRPSRPKVAFVMGANYGVFPAINENASILNNNERRLLNSAGLCVRDKAVFETVEENLLVYSCLCCASDMLFVTYHEMGSDGKTTEPSAFVYSLKNGLNGIKVVKEPESDIQADNLPETKADLFRLLCDATGRRSESRSTLYAATENDAELKDKFYNIILSTAKQNMSLEPDIAKKLFKNNIYLSATKFDIYHTCRFRYFCQYGLDTKIIQPAKLDTLQRGTIVHYVIEQFCNAHLDDIEKVEKQQIIEETDLYISNYFAEIKGSEYLFTARFNFILKKMKEGIVEVIERITEEFKQSKFRPEKCEVKIGNDGTIPTVEFPFSKDGKLLLTGSIDRLDRWGSFIRIVDYKTGSKSFHLSDTLYGQNLQMLIYLYCVIRGENPSYKGKNPAGILYLISKKDLSKKGMAMNGLLCENMDVVEAMEKENEGVFVPKYRVKKDGTPYKNNTSYISEEAFNVIFDYIEKLAKNMGKELHAGNIEVDPIDSCDNDACKYCQYSAVCQIEDEEHKKIEKLDNNNIIEILRWGEADEV